MRIPRLTVASALAFIVVAFVDRPLLAAHLDRSFGSSGKVITDVSGRFDEIRAIVIQSDGRIVVAGVTGTAPDRDFALARYETDGSLDRSFGVSGTVVTDFRRSDDLALAVTVQSDGKLVAAGSASGDVAVARYHPDGTLDRSFGASGTTTLDFGGDDRALAVAIQRDSEIVVAGVAGGRDFAIARLDQNGRSDPTFGPTGRVTTDFSGNPDVAYAIAIRPDSRIIVVGYTGGFPLAQFAVAQYYADGSADNSFGVEGKATVGFGRDARAHGLTVGNEGEITVGGFMNNGSSTDAVFARLTADGVLDASFGVAGRVLTDFGGRNFASALAFQTDGRVIVAGSDDGPPYYDFAIARYEADGSPDRSFSADGTAITNFEGNSWINAVAVQGDGKIVAAGYARGASGADFALVRYQAGR